MIPHSRDPTTFSGRAYDFPRKLESSHPTWCPVLSSLRSKVIGICCLSLFFDEERRQKKGTWPGECFVCRRSTSLNPYHYSVSWPCLSMALLTIALLQCCLTIAACLHSKVINVSVFYHLCTLSALGFLLEIIATLCTASIVLPMGLMAETGWGYDFRKSCINLVQVLAYRLPFMT